jgi:hypothetical protein
MQEGNSSRQGVTRWLCHETGHHCRTAGLNSDGLKYGMVCCTPRLAQFPHRERI